MTTTNKASSTVSTPSKKGEKIVRNNHLIKAASPSRSLENYFSPSKRSSYSILLNKKENKNSNVLEVRDPADAKKRGIDQVLGPINRPDIVKRPCNSLPSSSFVARNTTSTTERLYGFVRVPPNEISDNLAILNEQQPQAATPVIVELEQGYVLGRGPPSTKHPTFRSLGIEESCDGVSRQQVQILCVHPDKGGLDLECCATAKNKIGIVPHQKDCSSSQKRQLQLHASKEINGVLYVIPGKSARLQLNDWVIFDLYRRIPMNVFRLAWLKDEVGKCTFIKRQSDDGIYTAPSLAIADEDVDMEATQDMFLFNAQITNSTNSLNTVGPSETDQAIASEAEVSDDEQNEFGRNSGANAVDDTDADLREMQNTEVIDALDINDPNGRIASNVEATSKTIRISSNILHPIQDPAVCGTDEASPASADSLNVATLSLPGVAGVVADEGNDVIHTGGTGNIPPHLLGSDGRSSLLEEDDFHPKEECEGGRINDSPAMSVNGDIDATENTPLQPANNSSSQKSAVIRSELHPSLSNLLWRALNSAEPDNGISILTELLSLYSIVPGKGMYKQIFELLIDGPISEGYTYFDPNKSEIVYEYAVELVRKFPTVTLGPDWDAINRLYSRISNIPALDYSSHDAFCILQQVASALEYLHVLIENDLSMMQHLHINDLKDILKTRVSHSFFLNPGGIRESVKQTAKVAMQFLIQSEKFILNKNGARGENHERCCGAALRCQRGMVKLSYLVSSLFCLCEGINPDSNDLLFLLKDVIEAELSIVCMKPIEQRRLKISFLVYLDLADVTSSLMSRLVTMLRLTKEVSFLLI
jgi:hypothetical protein